jgi:hypothetical protein
MPSRLDASEAARTAMANRIPVAFAVTYLVGMTGAAWILSQLAPKLMRVDLAEECRKLEEQLKGGSTLQASARREFEFRAYAVDPGSRLVGRGVADLEAMAPRIFVEQVRRRGEIIDAGTRICCGKATWWRSPAGARRSLKCSRRRAADCAKWTTGRCLMCRARSWTWW